MDSFAVDMNIQLSLLDDAKGLDREEPFSNGTKVLYSINTIS